MTNFFLIMSEQTAIQVPELSDDDVEKFMSGDIGVFKCEGGLFYEMVDLAAEPESKKGDWQLGARTEDKTLKVVITQRQDDGIQIIEQDVQRVRFYEDDNRCEVRLMNGTFKEYENLYRVDVVTAFETLDLSKVNELAKLKFT